tara:strand:+ start:298 stop:495 length:198 start_codon:yes stop_codon:yes gene_type:complete
MFPVPLQKVQITIPLASQKAHSPIAVFPSTHTIQLFFPSPSHTQQLLELQLLNSSIGIKKIDLIK